MSGQPVFDAILARRSIRAFQEKPVPRDLAEHLLQAAMAAPSACNLQPWTFIVADDRDTLTRIEDTTEQGQYHAPLAVVICGETRHIPWKGEGWLLDLGAAMQNLMLAATELGLGSVCIGGFDEEALRKLLEIPEEAHPACILEIGYPAATRPPRSWYTEEAVHWNRYDRNRTRHFRTLAMLREDAKAGIL